MVTRFILGTWAREVLAFSRQVAAESQSGGPRCSALGGKEAMLWVAEAKVAFYPCDTMNVTSVVTAAVP